MSAYWPISFSLLYIRPSKPIFINILTALKGNTSVSPLNHCLPHYCYIFQYSIISISTQSYINSKTSIKGINNKWSSYRELNSRPLPYQGSALPLSYMSVYWNLWTALKKISRCSNNYWLSWWFIVMLCDGVYMERVAGIEPASLAWKAKVLPLYHTRIYSYSG